MELPPDSLSNLLSTDPLKGEDALDGFLKLGPECLRTAVPLAGTVPPGSMLAGRRLAKLCLRFGDPAWSILVDVLRNGSMPARNRAAECFALYPVDSGSKFSEDIAELMKSRDRYVAHTAMEALGYMGAHGWAHPMLWEIAGSRGGMEDHGIVAIKSAMNMVSRARNPNDSGYLLRTIAQYFEAHQESCKFQHPEIWLRSGALEFAASAADPLVEFWLTHRNAQIRAAAIGALGAMGLRRTAGALAARLADASEDEELRAMAARYLGEIGGDIAVRELKRVFSHSANSKPLREAAL